MQPIPWQCRGKLSSTTIELLLETVFSTLSLQGGYKIENWEYRNPARIQNFLKIYALLAPVNNKQAIEKAILKIVQMHIEEKGLLNASQFDFRS
jgi:hypothetical protein